jgi:hypothetical protein
MGLLRRAGLAVPGQQGEGREEAPSGGRTGLRSRSLRILRGSSPVSPPPPGPQPRPPVPPVSAPDAVLSSPAPVPAEAEPAAVEKPESVAATASDILAALRALPDGVELPSRVFGVLKESLGIRRGALLLYDPARMVYAPWASSGLDQTTLHRLRISLGALPTLNALADGKAVTIEGGQALADYQRFFSSREFAAIERLVIAPFIAESRLIGALLVAEAAPPCDDPARLAACLDEVASGASPAMRRARGETMKAQAAAQPAADLPLREQLARLLQAPRPEGTGLLFFSVQTSGFERQVLDAHPYLDPFRLREDIRYFVGAFASDLGAAFPLPGGGLLLGLRGQDSRSVDLLTHQLGLFLSSLFGSYDGRGAELAVLRSRALPEEGHAPLAPGGADPAELAAFFAS